MKKVQWTFDSEAENINLNNSRLYSDNWDNFIFLIIGRNLIGTMAHLRCARPIWTMSPGCKHCIVSFIVQIVEAHLCAIVPIGWWVIKK